MPIFIECVENDITLGEICNTLRGVWGDAKRVAEGVRADHLARYRVPGICLHQRLLPLSLSIPPPKAPTAQRVSGRCSIPTTPAITNAIYNAVGVRIDKTPVDQELIARELWERERK